MVTTNKITKNYAKNYRSNILLWDQNECGPHTERSLKIALIQEWYNLYIYFFFSFSSCYWRSLCCCCWANTILNLQCEKKDIQWMREKRNKKNRLGNCKMFLKTNSLVLIRLEMKRRTQAQVKKWAIHKEITIYFHSIFNKSFSCCIHSNLKSFLAAFVRMPGFCALWLPFWIIWICI